MNPSPQGSYSGYSTQVARTDPRSNFASTRDTINLMRGLVMDSLNSTQVINAASRLYPNTSAPMGNPPSEEDICRRVFWWTKNQIRLTEDEDTLTSNFGYTRDDLLATQGKELLMSPAFILAQPSGSAVGDCDDFSMLCACMLLRVGIPREHIYFCTVAADDMSPQDFTHVYIAVRMSNAHTKEPMALDCSHGDYPGWEETRVFNKLYWKV